MAGLNFIKNERTNNTFLRWIGNTAGSIAHRSLVEAVWLSEEDSNGFWMKYHGRMYSWFNPLYERWGTYYTLPEKPRKKAAKKAVKKAPAKKKAVAKKATPKKKANTKKSSKK